MGVNKTFFLALVMLTTGLSTVMSMMAIAMCSMVLASRHECRLGDKTISKGSKYLLILIYKQYIQDDSCGYYKQPQLTTANTVFVLASIWLALSLFNLLAALVMLTVAWCRSGPVQLMIVSYWHGVANLAVVIVQITLATHFGKDFASMTQMMDEYEAGIDSNYALDTLRHGAFFLMCLVMKGFVAPALNLLLLLVVVFLSHELSFEMMRERDENHSIHSRGVIDAFDQPKNDDMWQYQPDWTTSYSSGSPSHLRAGMWRNTAGESSAQLTNTNTRSHQWSSPSGREDQSGPAYPGRQSRYRNPAPSPSVAVKPDPPTARPQGPPVDIPAPDYSPRLPLKSALKSPYA